MKFTERDTTVAIAAAVLAFIVSVIALDMHGYINHSNKADSNVIESFKLVVMGTDGFAKVSSKSSNKEAFCADGFLLIRPQQNKSGNQVAGLLVNDKNRPVPCSTELPAPQG